MPLNGTAGGITDIEISDLDGLFDVTITSPANGQTIVYQNGQWVNASAASGGTGTVTSAGVVGNNGITVGGSPVNTEGVFTLGLGDITPTNISTSAGTFTGKLSGTTAVFAGLVSADSGIRTTIVSADSLNITGDLRALTGRVLASAATISALLTGAAASFSGIVSANAGLAATTGGFSGLVNAGGGLNTTIVSAASVNVTGDILAATGRVTASAATLTAKLTGQAASFSGVVSADAGLRATIVSADSVNITGDLRALTGRVLASAATISALLTGAAASFSGIVSADAGLVGTTGSFSGVVSANAGIKSTIGTFSGKVSADAGLNTTTVSAASIGITGDFNAGGRIFASAASITGIVSATNVFTAIVSIAFNGTTATDASLASYFRGTAVSAFTLSNPTNATDGQKIIWEVIQDATGNRNITLGNAFALGTDITAVTLSSAANTRSFLGVFYNATANKFYVTALVRGY